MNAIVKYRWIIIGAVIIITAFLGYQIKDLKINSDIINALPDTDRDAVMIKSIGEKFGGNKMGMVILETEDLFKAEVLEHILQITDTQTGTQFIFGMNDNGTPQEIAPYGIKTDARWFKLVYRGGAIEDYWLKQESYFIFQPPEGTAFNFR